MSEDFEIKQISEREIWIGKSRYYLNKDNILYINAIGELDDRLVAIHKKINLKFLNMVEGKLNYMLDFNKAGKQSKEARKTWDELKLHEKVGKAAIYGVHPVARIVAFFVIGFSKKNNIQFFKTEEEALNWLKQ